MDISSFETLQIFLFLIPGFLSAKIIDTLIVREEKREFEKIIDALILSMVIYTIYSLLGGKSPISINQIDKSFKYTCWSFLGLVALSILIPAIFCAFVTNDWHMKIGRKIGITRKTSRSSVWFDVFSDKRTHVIINFENGRRIYGWPMYYSNTNKAPYIYLYNPAWIIGDTFVDFNIIDGILITPEQKIESIEFLKNTQKEGTKNV